MIYVAGHHGCVVNQVEFTNNRHLFFTYRESLHIWYSTCRPKNTKLFKDKEGNLITYIEDCVASGKKPCFTDKTFLIRKR